MSDRKVGRYIIAASSEDKIFFPKSKITKGELLDYYQRIAPIMLTHCKNRLISMERFPDSITAEGFYHKDAPEYYPSWIKRVPVKTIDGKKWWSMCACKTRQPSSTLQIKGALRHTGG